jgi:hypothetical protein
MTNLKRTLATGLAAATLALILTNLLGAQAILQSPYAEPAHDLFMSTGLGGPTSESQMHTGPTSESQMMQSRMGGPLVNNVLGGQAGAAAGLAAVSLYYGVIPMAAAAFVVSWKQRSFPVAGLLAASGIIIMIPTLIATEYLTVIVIPGPILGFISGLAIFGLGVTKGIRTARAVTVAPK